MSASLELNGKGAIVTGGGSGINLAFVKQLHELGCRILIVDIKLHQDAVQWLDSLDNDARAKVHFLKADISDWGNLENAFVTYDKLIGGVPYIVCPGAGVYEPSHKGFWSDDDVNGHYRLFDINLLSPIKMTRLTIRKMLNANQPGIIIHVTSTGAQKASIITPLYQASKSAISSFVRSMGQLHEFEGIRVVACAPGLVRSPLFTENPKALKFIDPSKDTMLDPEAVARAMVAVAFDSRYPSGTILECADVGDNWRVVQQFNDPGPQGKASWSSNKSLGLEDVKKVLKSERRRFQG